MHLSTTIRETSLKLDGWLSWRITDDYGEENEILKYTVPKLKHTYSKSSGIIEEDGVEKVRARDGEWFQRQQDSCI